MTLRLPDDPDNIGPSPRQMLACAIRLFAICIKRLTDTLEVVDDLSPAAAKDLAEEFRALRKAVEIAYAERERLEKLQTRDRNADAGACHAESDRLRAEVESQLARISATSGAETVPEHPEPCGHPPSGL